MPGSKAYHPKKEENSRKKKHRFGFSSKTEHKHKEYKHTKLMEENRSLDLQRIIIMNKMLYAKKQNNNNNNLSVSGQPQRLELPSSDQKDSSVSKIEQSSQTNFGSSNEIMTKFPDLDQHIYEPRMLEKFLTRTFTTSSRHCLSTGNHSRDLHLMILSLTQPEENDTEDKCEERIRYMRNQVPKILGTQQMRFKLKTGLTTLINGSPTLNQVIAMDISGLASWSSWAALFDEYRIHKAKLVLLPIQCYIPSSAGTGTVNVGIPAGVVVDYDDATAIASTSALMLYDTMRVVFLGRSDETIFKITALPEGQPDLAWTTTSSPTVPFWFKTYQLLNPPANSMALAQIYLEVDVEFRQVG